ncbi:MAG: OsmC family protein, partial [Verrucomicrobiota bacterium]
FRLAGLGACTAMTLRMYADHKKLPLEAVEVRLRHEKVADPEAEGGKRDLIERDLIVLGNLSDEQRERMVEIADKCPVHRTLHNSPRVTTRLLSNS